MTLFETLARELILRLGINSDTIKFKFKSIILYCLFSKDTHELFEIEQKLHETERDCITRFIRAYSFQVRLNMIRKRTSDSF